jgi:type IV secretion system protein VirB4
MMSLAEYRPRGKHLPDYLPWAGLVAKGVVLNKNGSLQRTARFRGPDLESATEAELVSVSARLNNALKRLGTGWALFVEADRQPADEYPDGSFPEAASWIIEEERRAAFMEAGSHFESAYYVTFVLLPPPEHDAKLERTLLESSSPERRLDYAQVLADFVERTQRTFALLEGFMPEVAWLDDAETLTYLHGTISTARHPVKVPEVPFFLDWLLADKDLNGGFEPLLGRHHMKTLTVTGYPDTTWPALLDELNHLGFAYRWVTRWIAMDKHDAEGVLRFMRREWFKKRKGIMALMREVIYQRETQLIDTDAANKSVDADEALQELGSDLIAYGYLTTTVVVSDPDPVRAAEKIGIAATIIRNAGFTVMDETLNAVEAWLGSLPGHCHANVRMHPVSSLNLVHMIPLSAVWAGPARNEHLDGPPLIVAKSNGTTPFRLVHHVGDVGHMLVVGPTGAGKSVLLALMALQFRRYARSQVIWFDKGRSSRATVLALGGTFYDLGVDSRAGGNGLAFQPLSQIDSAAERAWAADWIAGLLAHENVLVTPPVKEALWSALNSLASAPAPQRTISGLAALIQSHALKAALQPYTIDGPFGRLLDADDDRMSEADVIAFEMEDLMHTPAAVPPVLTYLFHRLETRFDGRPTLMPLDEAWVFLDDPMFAPRLREWLKVLRKKNVAVVPATQSLADIAGSSIAPALIESCPSRILLPNDRAAEPQGRGFYERLGCSDRQIQLVAQAQPKRDYYIQSRAGNRLFELGLGPVALAFCAVGTKEDQALIDGILMAGEHSRFAEVWLREKGLDWAADLTRDFRSNTPEVTP